MLRPVAIKVIPLEDYHLQIYFDNDETRIFDVRPYITGNWYHKLSDVLYFRQAAADGYSVSWPDGQDICPDELYYRSVRVE